MFGSLDLHSTGLPRIDAQADFSRARRSYWVARIGHRLRPGSCGCLRALSGSSALAAGAPRHEVVPLSAIVGSVDPTLSFDRDFRPASSATRARWERIALAHRTGRALPPVSLRRQPDGYYVLDGRHRVSVARALRHRDIDAVVVGDLS